MGWPLRGGLRRVALLRPVGGQVAANARHRHGDELAGADLPKPAQDGGSRHGIESQEELAAGQLVFHSARSRDAMPSPMGRALARMSKVRTPSGKVIAIES